MTFYLTYVLLVSKLLRFYISGSIENIIYEGWHMEKFLVLCDAVRSARILENFFKEEYFYFQLVDLMRSPKQLKNISGDFQRLIAKNQESDKREWWIQSQIFFRHFWSILMISSSSLIWTSFRSMLLSREETFPLRICRISRSSSALVTPFDFFSSSIFRKLSLLVQDSLSDYLLVILRIPLNW